jgi:hypothetical protein
MSRTTRIIVAFLIAATLLGGYLIVARNVPPAGEDAPSGFLH